jgi:uncharacterized protein DUF2188
VSRIVYELVPNGGMWKVDRDGEFFGQWPTKDTAEQAARGAAVREHESGALTQVRVHKEDGKFDYESTYGDDPRDIPG